MKRTYNAFATIACVILLCSCTHTLYTHQQVLQNCHTKDDVWKQFGSPDEKHPGPAMEQWVYNMEKPHKSTKQKMPDQLMVNQVRPDTLASDSIQYVKQENYTSYIKFMFDTQGKVIGYKADGVDLTKKVKDNFGKSVVNITGGVLVVSVLVALELYKEGAFDN